MSDPQGLDPAVEEFRAAVQERFGAPWVVEPAVDGFVARYPLSHATREGFTASDEVHVRVVADGATRAYTWSSRRVAGHELDRARAGWSMSGYHASRTASSGRYSGMRRTMSFRRTSDGLVADPESSQDSAGREADLRAVGARLGWTERAASPGLGGTALPPRRTLVLAGVIFGVVLIAIVGIGIFVVSHVVAAFG